jgi:hypothetical protein
MLEAHHLADNSIVTTPAGRPELTWLVSILLSDPHSRSMANDGLVERMDRSWRCMK